MIAFKITPSELMAIVDRVAPFASTSKFEGRSVQSIRLQADGDTIFSSATNRYVAGIARTDVPGITETFDLMIDATELKLARKLFPVPRRRLAEALPITVEIDDALVRLSQPGASPAITVEFQLPDVPPPINLREKMAQWIGRRKQPSGRPVSISLDPQLLRKFDHLGHHVELHPALPESPDKQTYPVLVFADHFAGAIMTRRSDGYPNLVGPWSLQPSLDPEGGQS